MVRLEHLEPVLAGREWLAGSFALGLLVAAVCTAVTYACARLARSLEG